MENRQVLDIKSISIVVAIILIAALIRILPHPANFTPIAAMALFGGAYLSRKYALFVPLVTMFVADLFIGFHSQMAFVYGSLILTGLIGLWLSNKLTTRNVIGASLLSSVIFFLITNFGVWYIGPSAYKGDITGLIDAYIMGIPFFRNTVLGDLFYTATFFGVYELVAKKIFKLVRASY